MPEKLSKIVIGGSRSFFNFPFFNYNLKAFLLEKFNNKNIKLVSGGAEGVDLMVKEFAKLYDIPFTEFSVTKKEWKAFGRVAGPLRNEKMVINGDYIVAFWDGKKGETKNLIDLAKRYDKPLEIIYITSDSIEEFFRR